MSSILSTKLEEFFAQEIHQIAEREHIVFSPRVVTYVVNVLMEFQESERFFSGDTKLPILADFISEMMDANEIRKKTLLKQVGDTSLMLTGYFPEALERRCVSLSYYQQMGESAYSQLASMTSTMSVFDELSGRFNLVTQVLNEFSESAQGRDISIPRMLDHYRESSSQRLLDKLKKVGVIPFEAKRESSS